LKSRSRYDELARRAATIRTKDTAGTLRPSVGLKVDDEFEFGGLQDRKVGGLFARENTAVVDAYALRWSLLLLNDQGKHC
jgi:hypothetical protein